MKKIGLLAICLGTSILMVGCGQASKGEADSQDRHTQTTSSVSQGADQNLLEQLENISLDVEGEYIRKTIDNDSIEKEYKRTREFTGNLKDVKIISQDKEDITVKAVVANDFYTTVEPITIHFQLKNNEIGSGVIEDNQPKVQPTIPYTLDMIFGKELKLTYVEGLEEKKFTVSRDTVEKIGYEYETGNVTGGFCGISDFSYEGHVIFYCKDGRKLKQSVDIDYRPDKDKEYTLESDKSIWRISTKENARFIE